MGSIKDEMRHLVEDHQLCEKTDDGEHPGGSDGSVVPEGPQLNTSQESTTQWDNQLKLQVDVSTAEDGGNNPISKDPALSGGESNNTDSIQIKVHTEGGAILPTQQPETTAIHNNVTISNKVVKDGEGEAEIQGEGSQDKSSAQDRKKEAETETIMVPVPSTPNTFDPTSPDPRSPAPMGQHHMRTQVSLEVVQCHSAATSPMTPPEGSHSFFFPSSFGRSEGVGTDTKDAELQVGQQVEFCSVATSPMTPKTPSTTAFPELIGRETVQKEERVKKSGDHREGGQHKSFPVTKTLAEAESEISGAMKFGTSKELTEHSSSNASPESSASCPAAGLIESQGNKGGSDQQCKQQRMGSMDQDITILVTHYSNGEEEDNEEKAELSFHSTEPELVKIDENEEIVAPDQTQDILNTIAPQSKTEESSAPAGEIKSGSSEAGENKEEVKNVSMTKPPVPESPAPFGCHNIRTQVSLEVVQCQSVATSPMTPPEGDHAFYFPSSFGKHGAVGAETKDAELQVGQQVEFRSVATAPMTPRTPITTTFPEIRKEASVEEKIVEEEEDEKLEAEKGEEEALKEKEKITEKKKVEASEEDKKVVIHCNEKDEEKCEEPVQEVSWDEKGMTWEVYGAVVEVAVLGSAIQKHLEKQVKKQKRQASMPPPPPLNPSATPLTLESTQGVSWSSKGRAAKRGEQDGKVSRRRRNPFRLLMENMQQPHCCSRAHTTE